MWTLPFVFPSSTNIFLTGATTQTNDTQVAHFPPGLIHLKLEGNPVASTEGYFETYCAMPKCVARACASTCPADVPLRRAFTGC